MKRESIAYWVLNGLFAAFIALGSVFDVMMVPEAVELFDRLGYPTYLLPFLGIAKLVGAAAVLLPAPPTVKEWAYAGLAYDLIGAIYSHIMIADPLWWGPAIPLLVMLPAYALHRRRRSPARLRFQGSPA
jgi:hypothetical protein